MKYRHQDFENKWQEKWDKLHIYKTKENPNKRKYYVLDMFPYPSGSGLHVGHPKGYIATDIIARKKSMQGFNVLHPMGWDAFGLPAENYALKHKVHPRKSTEKNIAYFKSQLKRLGLNYDWQREINTSDPQFYKWTQWIFLQLFKKGLAYESYEPINWCPNCKTGLSNEDLEGDKCERCGTLVEKKPMKQWMLRITDYADRLLDDLSKLDQWEDSIKTMQKNWIGKSVGAEITFQLLLEQGDVYDLPVFTTRPDTLHGATYVVISPEHKILNKILNLLKNREEIINYVKISGEKSEIERTNENKPKTGVKLLGLVAVNPLNKQKIPVFVADYVLSNYGTGAIMAVPAHDQRDYDFAKKYKLPIKQVIQPIDQNLQNDDVYIGDGVLINSQSWNGKLTPQQIPEIIKDLATKSYAKPSVQYKIKDWVFSRQRYWGEPIPLVHCKKCGIVAVSESDLPVKLPEVDHYEPSGTGESPLAKIDSWVNVFCPKCGGKAKRETNTMPQWAGSSWYYLRYLDPNNNNKLVSSKKEKYWNPVDLYVGGAEHATRHLIYARFWHKFLFDMGIVSYDEPFKKLQHVGLIIAEDGRKMSKRWGNVINPDKIVAEFGADALRVYEMFMSPFNQSCAWNSRSLIGVRKFLDKVWQLQKFVDDKNAPDQKTEESLQKTIYKVGKDIDNFKLNTAISAMMIWVNQVIKSKKISMDQYKRFLLILAPFAPYLTEEIWQTLNETASKNNSSIKNPKFMSIHQQKWPKYDKKFLQNSTVEIIVQVNGKKRGLVVASRDIKRQELLKIIEQDSKFDAYLLDKKIKKTIYIPGRLINFVI